MLLKSKLAFVGAILAIALLFSFNESAPRASADEIPMNDGGLNIKMAVGLERWHPIPPPFALVEVADGEGWFYQCDLRLLDINYIIPMMGYRAIDIEVESWGDDPRFSAVFVRDASVFGVAHSMVVVGEEEDVRAQLFGGQLNNYRMVDLEVHQYAPTPPPAKRGSPQQITTLSREIAALVVMNEGNQATPVWDFIIHASPIERMIWTDSFPNQMRVIDHELSLDASIGLSNDPEQILDVRYSEIIVFDEAVEHVPTSYFQYTNQLDLALLAADGWQLIDSERNIPLMPTLHPDLYGTFTGLFVQKGTEFDFNESVNGYSTEMEWTTDDKRMIDLELVPIRNNTEFRIDETYLIYE